MYIYMNVCIYACMYFCMNKTINLMNLKKRLKQKIILIKTLERFFCCLLDSCLIKESKKKQKSMFMLLKIWEILGNKKLIQLNISQFNYTMSFILHNHQYHIENLPPFSYFCFAILSLHRNLGQISFPLQPSSQNSVGCLGNLIVLVLFLRTLANNFFFAIEFHHSVAKDQNNNNRSI